MPKPKTCFDGKGCTLVDEYTPAGEHIGVVCTRCLELTPFK